MLVECVLLLEGVLAMNTGVLLLECVLSTNTGSGPRGAGGEHGDAANGTNYQLTIVMLLQILKY